MKYNYKTKGLFALQRVVNLNERQKGTDERAQGNEAMSQQDRQWLSPLAFSWTCLLQAFPVSPLHLCTSLEGGLAYGLVISTVSCIISPFCPSPCDSFKCLWLASSQQREKKGISYILPSSETGISIQVLRWVRFTKVLSSLGRARG